MAGRQPRQNKKDWHTVLIGGMHCAGGAWEGEEGGQEYREGKEHHNIMYLAFIPLPLPVQVPREAWGMDLCFADSESMAASGFVDDNGGLDYHVPIEGAGEWLWTQRKM